MEAIVLAGGFGTRLSHIISDVPKPMAPIHDIPFLQYLFDYLVDNKVERVILAVGYKAEVIKAYFGASYRSLALEYSMEDSPLGTGGAIKKAISLCKEKDIFIINGDTYFNVDLKQMGEFHKSNKSVLTVAVKQMQNFDRYGTVVIKDNYIEQFEEKKPTAEGKINGGIYCIRRDVLDRVDLEQFSFEKIVLESDLVTIMAFESDGYFIDIGIPEDYFLAQKVF